MDTLKIKLIVGLFSIIWVFHLLRLMFKVPVVVGGWSVPLYFSVIALIVIGALIIWLIRT